MELAVLGGRMISYGSAMGIGAPRCVRTLDPAARLGQAMPVCGAPVAGGPGLRALLPGLRRPADHAGGVPAAGAALRWPSTSAGPRC